MTSLSWIALFAGALLVGLEGLARRRKILPAQATVTARCWIRDRLLGFVNRPSMCYKNINIQGHPVITTDRWGFRTTADLAAGSGAPVVVFVGDSMTFGAELADKDTFCSKVAHLLLNPPVSVINAGVRGFSSVQSLLMIEKLASMGIEPSLIIYCFYANDMYENLHSHIHYPAQAPILVRSGSDGPWSILGLSHRYQSLSGLPVFLTISQAVQSKNFFLCLWTLASFTSLFTVILKSKLPRWAGWSRMRRRPLEKVPPSRFSKLKVLHDWAQSQGSIGALEYCLQQMQIQCNTMKAKFAVTAAITSSKTSWPCLISEICGENGLTFIDLRSGFGNSMAPYLAKKDDGSYDGHYGEIGAEAFANTIAPEIAKLLTPDSHPQATAAPYWR